jgi:V/A-type H+/Na+-transporting ATPase subunit I
MVDRSIFFLYIITHSRQRTDVPPPMPVVKMQKVALLSHTSHREALLDFLQDEGVMEVTPNADTVDIDHPQIQYQEAEIRFAIDFLLPHASREIRKELKMKVSVDEVRKSAIQTDFHSIIEECKTLEDQRAGVRTEKQKLCAEQEQLTPWTALPFRLSEQETKTTQLILGTVASTGLDTLRAEMQKSQVRSELMHIHDNKDQALIAAILWKEDQEKFEHTVARHGWTTVTLPALEKMPVQELARMKQALRVIAGKETEITRKTQELTKHLPHLARLALFLHWMDEKQAVRSEMSQTKQTSTLTGWVPQKQCNTLTEKLEKKFPAAVLMEIEPGLDEDPPMQIHNFDALAPFEAVTRLYGLPQSGEMDPTRPLMPFFILYFALCLTDAGYGLVLATLMGLAIWKFKLKRQDQKLVWLLFYAGIVTFFVAIPFGGWFGMTPDQAPAFATKMTSVGLRFKGQVWDLNKDVTFFQNLALSLGAIQLLFGIFLAGYWKWIHGRKFEAVATHFSAHFFVIALLLKYYIGMPGADYVLMVIGALFVWGQGSGTWYMRPLIGVLGTVNFLISMMSNILSYLRILALGLATGALAYAINQIAAVINDLLPGFLGIPVFIIILLFGHMISIALNGLGSFVHSGRLQFIEFFGQFFKGGGREFTPFKRTLYSI